MSTSGSSSVVRVSGNGYVPLVFSRSSKSAAPNIPTYISVICGNTSVYSGAFNTTKSGAFSKKIPYQGNCNIKIAVRNLQADGMALITQLLLATARLRRFQARVTLPKRSGILSL